jgi:hypothetical protein
VNAEAVRAELREAREAGEALRARSLADVHADLARIFDHWSDPTSDGRRALAAELPAATGLHPATVAEGLQRGLATWTGEAFLALAHQELVGADAATGFPTTAVLLAGEIPMPSLLSMLAPLAVRSPVLVKMGSRDPATAPCVAHSLESVAPRLALALHVLPPLAKSDALAALLEADCVMATGSDATIESVARRLRPEQRFVPAGHRFSVAAIGEEALTGSELSDTAQRLASDIALWDQQGCLSPIACYVVSRSDAAPDRLSDALAEALAEAERRWPRGRVTAEAAARIHHERAEAEMRGAAQAGVTLLRGECWSVVREADATPRPAPLHRFVRVHPLADTSALLDALRPTARHLAGIALAGFGGREAELAEALTALGATRTCAIGTLQSPPLGWRREGRDILTPLLEPRE